MNKITRIFYLGILCSFIWGSVVFSQQLGPFPVNQWTIKAKQGDVVSLTQSGKNIIGINYNVNVKKWNVPAGARQTSFDLLLNSPVFLDTSYKNSSIRHLIFQTYRFVYGENPDNLEIYPILQDSQGERFYFIPRYYYYLEDIMQSYLSRTIQGWVTWVTPDFYSSEAGGASAGVYFVKGGKNTWPVGKLTFLGFKLVVRNPSNFGREQGMVAIGKISDCGIEIPYHNPYFYADNILTQKGTYTISYKISNQFQGLPVIQGSQKIIYNPTDLSSQHQKIVFPLGPNNTYWITYQITNNKGNIIATNSFRFFIWNNPDKTPVKTISPDTTPVLGYMWFNPISHTKGVYMPKEPLKVIVRVFPKNKKDLLLNWNITPYGFPTQVLEHGSKKVISIFNISEDRKFIDVPIIVQKLSDRDVYRIILNLYSGKNKIDTADYLIGIKTGIKGIKPYLYQGRPGKLFFTRNYVKKHAFIHISYEQPWPIKFLDNSFTTEGGVIKDFSQTIDQISHITKYVDYCLDVRDLEVLPGVYDFTLLDKLMNAADKRGMHLIFNIAHSDSNGQYNWLKYYPQITYDGRITYHLAGYGSFSVADRGNTKLWEDTCKALYERYKENPGFEGWYLLEPSGEVIVDDRPWMGEISGYEKPMQEAFKNYMRYRLNLSLTQLNQRWSTNYTSWKQVKAPLPIFGQKPDLTRQWVDWSKFKAYMNNDWGSSPHHDYWFFTLCSSIRKYSKNHLIIVYGDTNTAEGLADYGHNGGNTFFPEYGEYLNAWNKYKTGWISEPSWPFGWAYTNDPNGLSWTLDWTIWVMTAQAGGGGANMHVWYPASNWPQGLLAKYGGNLAYDRWQKYKPILEELHNMTLILPSHPEVATLNDDYTLWCKHRTTFIPRLSDLSRWFELLTSNAIEYEKFEPKQISHYRLILPNILDEVLSKKDIENLVKAVKDYGAKTIICANTGKYSPAYGNEKFVLLKALGINPPTGKYNILDTNVYANVITDNPLFSKGSRIKFFTLRDLHIDLSNPKLLDSAYFWNWPYRFIPETNYFGYYKNNKGTNGKILARFSTGAVALSEYNVGKGQVIVFWGTPDYQTKYLKGMMKKAVEWAKAKNPTAGEALPFMLEGYNKTLDRWYILIYNYGNKPGTYYQKFPKIPNGDWFVDELVSDQKLGTYTGKELRDGKMPITYLEGYSPLKIYRLQPSNQIAVWLDKYRMPSTPKK